MSCTSHWHCTENAAHHCAGKRGRLSCPDCGEIDEDPVPPPDGSVGMLWRYRVETAPGSPEGESRLVDRVVRVRVFPIVGARAYSPSGSTAFAGRRPREAVARMARRDVGEEALLALRRVEIDPVPESAELPRLLVVEFDGTYGDGDVYRVVAHAESPEMAPQRGRRLFFGGTAPVGARVVPIGEYVSVGKVHVQASAPAPADWETARGAGRP